MAHKQIATEPTAPFARRGLPSWPAWERALCTALEKDATRRFSSVAGFAGALADALHERAHEESGLPTDVVAPIVDECLHTLVSDLGLGGKAPEAVIDHPPMCSVNYGAAGAAYALYRRAVVANDGLSLAAADVWATWAHVHTRTRAAFVSREHELTPETVGKASLYHTSCGVHAVRVLVASALGDYYTMRHGVRAYLRAARVPSLNFDVTLGRAGLLLGCAHLLDALPNDRFVSRRGLRGLGVSLARQIEDTLSPLAPIGVETQIRNLGIAHGWAGMLYALLVWHRVARTAPVSMIRDRLRQLANAGEPRGRGMRWPWLQPATAASDDRTGDQYEQSYMAGWCNGSAGFVFLWLLARETYGDAMFDDLAHAAAWNAWEEPSDSGVEHLCCGSAGRAYAMLAMYRRHRDAAWLQRARELCELAIDNLDESLGPVWSLYKGALGVAVLARDLEQPHLARMPLFELESWSMST